MTTPRTKRILYRYSELPEEIRSYFSDFPDLVAGFDWDVSISYMFSRVELAHNNTIYCGVVKLHRVDNDLASTAVDDWHMTRNGFRDLYETIFGKKLKKTVSQRIEAAEKTRDRIVHGKRVSEEDKRKAVINILEYSEAFNAEVHNIAGFKPFGSLRGFKGAGKKLDKSTSRWILKGVGLSIG